MRTVESFLNDIESLNPARPMLLQTVEEVARSVWPRLHQEPEWQEALVLERLIEPDRSVSFRVVWETDDGELRMDRGFRVQQSNVLGPYKGGLRFSPGVTPDDFRFLAFEQTFKNALTGLPLGAGKGGATFEPKGKSDREVMRFCQSFMTELHRHIGPSRDVPAGDIGVGQREIGFLYGAYRRLELAGAGVLTGKQPGWGGIPLRAEATGYGLVYLLREALRRHDRDLDGMRVAISGAGNVATHAAEKVCELGGTVISMSSSKGTAFIQDGFSKDELGRVVEALRDGERLEDLAGDRVARMTFQRGAKPWGLDDVNVALPCATQNEMDVDDAKALLGGDHLAAIAEGANMPLTSDATRAVRERREVVYLPGKAANAGGVSISGLEMAQNAQRIPWTRASVDEALQARMSHIHERCVACSDRDRPVDYVVGANVAALERLAEATMAQGFA